MLAATPALQAQTPPDPPVIIDPPFDGEIAAPSDVHMETQPMTDPDVGDTHACSDWEIWSVTPSALAWASYCATGAASTHIHLGDGDFLNAHASRTELFAETNYVLQVRFQDQTGLWSSWSQRLFTTGAASEVFPMELDDIASLPAPLWVDSDGLAIELPGDAPPAILRLESGTGELLLELAGQDSVGNAIVNPPMLPNHEPARVRVTTGASALVLPLSDLSFVEHSGEDREVYLPSMNLPAFKDTILWISTNGSTYWGDTSQTQPDFSALARSAPVPWSVLQPGYEVDIVATGFTLPVFIAFVPNPGENPGDPYYYVTELYGSIKVVTRDGTVSDYATDLLNYNPLGSFPGAGEKGLGGLAVDPTTGDLFLGLLYDAAPPNGPHYPKVIRLHSSDGGLTADSTSTVLDMPGEIMNASHFISDLSIGPDGKLYVHMGDSQVIASALDLTTFRGKILRLNLDGTAPTDNPFYDTQNPFPATNYIFAYGFRNPFGGVWRAADGAHYEVENGPSRNDRFARVDAGASYGWSGTHASMTVGAIYNWFIPRAPVDIAFIEPQTFGGSGFPVEKQDHAFVTESGPTYASGNGKQIVEFVVDLDGNLVSGPTPFVAYNGIGHASAAGIAAGPDGLYFTDLYKDLGATNPYDTGANVLRIRFVGIADFEADITRGEYPLTVQFTNLSTVPNATAWKWYFGDGATSDQQNPQHVYTEYGYYDVRLEVTSATGLVSEQKSAYIVAINETSVEDGSNPATFVLYQSAPNPFEGSTLIRYNLASFTHVRLRVYDASGRLVQVLVDAHQAAGPQQASWTGRDRRGQRAAAGVYFIKLEAGGRSSSQRVVRTR